MAKKIICTLLAALMLVGVTACSKEEPAPAEPADPVVSETTVEEKLDYTFGLNETFHSDEPVTYTMYFSDASWYPMVDTWKTEGVFEKIREMTNVTLDITSYDSGDYTNKITLDINAGQSKYIVPKVYDESMFVDGGAIVPVSDYTQYMPNFTAFVEEFDMQKDLDTIIRADGKFYRLPGMHETPNENYTFLVRSDLFDAAGVDVAAIEANWTWDDLYDALVKVKEYMVSEGICTEKDYIWSDLWAGSESGQNSGGNLLQIIGNTYGVKSGWAVGNTLCYDSAKDEWYCSSTSDDYKEFVSVVNKFISGGILDPETFTQDDTTATNKFYNGQTAIISVNQAQYSVFVESLENIVGADNCDTHICVVPKGSNAYGTSSTRLENGVMIAKNALEDLGEDGFIKMMRFVDWLWYSDEAYTLTKWGVEGEHYQLVKDPATGIDVKQLMPGFKCGGLGITGAEEDLDIRLQWGYAGGNFWYGHRQSLRDDNLSPAIQDFLGRTAASREVKPLDPVVGTDEDQNELLNLWQTSIVDTVNTWTLNFVTGQKDISADWDTYVAELEAANLQSFLDMYNDAYNASK